MIEQIEEAKEWETYYRDKYHEISDEKPETKVYILELAHQNIILWEELELVEEENKQKENRK